MQYNPRDIIGAIERLAPHAPGLAEELLCLCRERDDLDEIADREGVASGLGSAFSSAYEAIERAHGGGA